MRWLQHFLIGGTLPTLTDDSRRAAEARMGYRLSSDEQQLQSSHKVLYDAVGQLSPGLSEEAFSTLIEDARSLELNVITLNFRNSAVEAEFQQHVAIRRRPILLLLFCFDVICYLFRMAVKFVKTDISFTALCKGILPQLCNMAFLWFFLGLLNRRSRRLGDSAARQEELMLTGIMTLAICNLLATINETNPQDYVYAAMFMISTTCFLKIQWLLGTVFMTLPLPVTYLWHRTSNILPSDAMVHLVVSWAVGGFMAYLSDTYRRQMFVNHRLAKIAAEKELQEAQARINVQQLLATAQAQAAQRALIVVREKAANEAKSEFMSVMCHEVRTPLNGCLASAEMLLETPLQEEQRELAKTIRVSGSILLSTVSNFLDFFKMEAGKQLDVVRTEMTTKDLVGDIHCIIEATIGRSSEVRLEKPNTEGVPDLVVGDPDRLRGILLNLYTNAAKFTKQGSIALRVRVASKDYRPSPEHVMQQKQRGPAGLETGHQPDGRKAGQDGRTSQQQDRTNDSGPWGKITAVSPRTRSAFANYEQPYAASDAAAASTQADAPTEDVTSLSGHAAQAASHAFLSLHRGYDAQAAADATHETHDIANPAVNEHIASDALLKCTAQVINKAANRMQTDAGNRVGHNKSQGRVHSFDLLEPVKEDVAASASEFQSADLLKSESPSAAPCVQQCESPQMQTIAADCVKLGSIAGRVSSNSVLDQQDDSSCSSGGSNPSDCKQEPEVPQDQASDSTDAAVWKLYSVWSRSTGPQGRQEGSPGAPMCERTQSNSDMTESDVSYRRSSGSFSSCPPPLRKSFSLPAEALHEAADRAIAGQRPSLEGPAAPSYSGMFSKKATARKKISTPVQDLGGDWFSVVAHRQAPTTVQTGSDSAQHAAKLYDAGEHASKQAFQSPPPPSDPEVQAGDNDQWLIFEVTDTGCGISQHALSSLFTEYVQGTEDDMKQPRTRGGTGLGLSICSKQVSVLGGLLGAMSKVGEGSTFWFTIPLVRPSQAAARQSISMRRTASWGSRDAFTDGHISHHADTPPVPAGRRTLAATSKAHRHKRSSYVPARSSKHQQQGQKSLRKSSSLNPEEAAGKSMHQQHLSEEAARRMSAPAAPSGRVLPNADKPGQTLGMHSAASDDSFIRPQHHGQTSARAKEAVAQAVLGSQDGTSSSGSSNERSSMESNRQSSELSFQASPERRSGSFKAPLTQSLQHLSGDSSNRGVMPYSALQRNLLAQYKAEAERTRPQATAVEDAQGPFGRGQPLQSLPEGTSSTFQAPDEGLSHQGAGSNGASARQHATSSDAGSRQANIRPSMEARRRRFDLSVLQNRSVLLAEDNLINQRVAKMMLCSLGMCCEVACNGQEAVNAVKRRIGQEGVCQFDVLLMDMAMPVMGGVDATKEIRRAGAAVPIVAMTANSSDKDRDECLEAGMDGFLSKPVLKDRLAEAILNAVSGRRQFQDRQTISLKAYDRL